MRAVICLAFQGNHLVDNKALHLGGKLDCRQIVARIHAVHPSVGIVAKPIAFAYEASQHKLPKRLVNYKVGSILSRSVLITGGSSGIGRHLGGLLGRHGYGVALAARRIDLLEVELEAIRQAGGRGFAVEMDVTDPDSVKRGFDLAEAALGPIDCVVANAGTSFSGKSIDFNVRELDRILAVNVRGAFLTAQAAARRMMARECSDGRIIFIASIASHQPLPGLAAYCASKAAVAMLGRSLAREWARQGINVNVICPGYVKTELNGDWFESEGGVRQVATFARRRLMDVRDLDGIILHLAAPESRAITGSVITIDDAQSL